MLNVRKIADIAQKMFNFPFFSPRMLFLSPLSLSLSRVLTFSSMERAAALAHSRLASSSLAWRGSQLTSSSLLGSAFVLFLIIFFVKMTLSFIWYIFVLMSKDLCRNEDLYLHKKLDGMFIWKCTHNTQQSVDSWLLAANDMANACMVSSCRIPRTRTTFVCEIMKCEESDDIAIRDLFWILLKVQWSRELR